MSKCFLKPLLQVYVLQKLLKVKIIKPQFFTTLDLLLSALNIHNLKMAFNLALNFSGWCILIFFKSKASGTIYKHDMSHLLFWGGRQAGECFFNCTTDYLQFCFRWNILDTRLLLLSCIIRVRNLSGYPCPVICVPLSVQLSVIFPSGAVILFFQLSIRLSVRVLFLMSLSR